MIHYHGTPAGGTKVDRILFCQSRHILVPFSYPIDIPNAIDVAKSFCLDNGAYTIWKKGGKLDVKAYIKWVRLYCRHPGFDFSIIPDVIDGEEDANKELAGSYPADLKGAPVFHYHESMDYLEYLTNNYSRVCLGSSGEYSAPGSKKWWTRTREVMEVVCDSDGRPKTKLHGLRMLSPKIFTRLPLSSADSTNASVNSGSIKRFGYYPSPTRAGRAHVIADRIESYNSSPIWINE